MDDAAQEQRRRSSADWMNEGATRLILFLARRSILSPFAGLGPIVLAVFGVIFFFTLLILITGGGVGIGIPGSPTPTPAPTPIAGSPPGGGTAYIAQCTFYYGDGKAVRIVNPSLAAFVESVAKKTDVPASVIMAILTRESSFLVGGGRPPNGTCDFDTDLCNVRSVANAIGAMQTIPATFKNAAGHYAREIKDAFNKELDREVSPNPNQNPGPDTLWIASLKDSIIVGTYEIKRLKRAAGERLPWNEETVRKVAQGYQGGEKSSEGVGCSGGYCNDAWKSVQGCEFSTIVAITPLVDAINTVCPTGVKSGNVDVCINNIPTSLNRVNEVRERIRGSAKGAGALQCIGFVQSLFPLLNYPDLERRVFPNEYLNPSYSSSKYIKIGPDFMQQGDVAVWAPNTGGASNNGHFAFVTATQKDKGFFTVTEANWCYDPDPKLMLPSECGKVSLRNVPFGGTSPTALFRKNQ